MPPCAQPRTQQGGSRFGNGKTRTGQIDEDFLLARSQIACRKRRTCLFERELAIFRAFRAYPGQDHPHHLAATLGEAFEQLSCLARKARHRRPLDQHGLEPGGQRILVHEIGDDPRFAGGGIVEEANLHEIS